VCHSVCAKAWKEINSNFKKEFGSNWMGGGLELCAIVYGSLAGSIENGNSCWLRNAPDVSFLSLEIKAGERKLVRAGLVFWLVC